MRITSTLAPIAMLAIHLPCIGADEAALLLAANVNFARAVETRCELLVPGYSVKFNAAYEKAHANFLLPSGVNESVLAQARNIPELAVLPLIAKFDKLGPEQQKRHCDQHLRGFVEAGERSQPAIVPK